MGAAVRQLGLRGGFANLLIVAGLLLVAVAAVAAPTGTLLPGPRTHIEAAVAALVLALVFLAGARLPVGALYGVVALTVLEGAIRKWAYNSIVVYLMKDFLLLGVVAAVVPTLTREKLRRPWWLLVPLAGLLGLALLYALRTPSHSQAIVGLRSYFIYVPLLWIAPAIIDTRRRWTALLVLICSLSIGEALLALAQILAGRASEINKLVSGAAPALFGIQGGEYVRPTGTFMQSGDLSFFLVLAFVAAIALVMVAETRRLRRLAVLTISVMAVSIVVTAARTLLASDALVLVGAFITFPFPRRVLPWILVPALALTGLVVAVKVAPSLFTASGAREIAGFVSRASTFNTRSTSPNAAGTTVLDTSLWSSRVDPQLTLISHQGFLGHGTGTMTLGAEYATPTATLQGESSYSKVAWELGLPGLVLFVWFVAAALWLTVRRFRSSSGWERSLSSASMWSALLVALWMLITFALDTPVVALLYFIFVGLASAPVSRAERAAPLATRAAATDLSATSAHRERP